MDENARLGAAFGMAVSSHMRPRFEHRNLEACLGQFARDHGSAEAGPDNKYPPIVPLRSVAVRSSCHRPRAETSAGLRFSPPLRNVAACVAFDQSRDHTGVKI